MRRPLALVFIAALSSLGASCGSGPGGYIGNHPVGTGTPSGSGGGSGGKTTTFTPGVFQAESKFAAQCAAPRTGTDPLSGRPYPDVQGSVLAENNWLRSWTHDMYLWYREVPDQDPGTFPATAGYFDVLKTAATTPSGAAKDKFHFTYATATWEALSQSGVQPGYGATWAIVAASPPRKVVVAYTEPNAPATTAPASLTRGAQVLTIDGADVATGDAATLNAGLTPATLGESHVFSILDPGATTPRAVTLVSSSVTSTPVQHAGAQQSGMIDELRAEHLKGCPGREELVVGCREKHFVGVAPSSRRSW